MHPVGSRQRATGQAGLRPGAEIRAGNHRGGTEAQGVSRRLWGERTM